MGRRPAAGSLPELKELLWAHGVLLRYLQLEGIVIVVFATLLLLLLLVLPLLLLRLLL